MNPASPAGPFSPATTWTAADYINHGLTCGTSSLQAQLDVVRQFGRAEAALLFVECNGAFFRSLILASAPQTSSVDLHRLRTDMVETPLDSSPLRLPNRPSHGPLGEALARFNLADRQPFRRVIEAFQPETPCLLSVYPEHQEPADELTAVVIDGAGRSAHVSDEDQDEPATILVVLIRRNARPAVSAVSESDYRNALRELWVMVNGSASVQVHRWNRLLRHVDNELDHLEQELEDKVESSNALFQIGKSMRALGEDERNPVSARSRNEAEAQLLSEDLHTILNTSADLMICKAAELTDSSVGHIYLAQTVREEKRYRDKLWLFAQSDSRIDPERWRADANLRRGREIEVYDNNKPEERNSVIAYAYRHKRAVLVNDIGELQNTHPGIEYRPPVSDKNDSYAELAVPIVMSTDTSKDKSGHKFGDMIIGVLNVEKRRGHDTGQYTFKDLHIMRHVAMRFCHWRNWLLHYFSAMSLARLTRSINLSRQANGAALVEAGGAGLPVDLLPAQPWVKTALQLVYEVTHSYWATIFLLSQDGLTLTRFCYESGGKPTPPPETEAIPVHRRDSTNAWVARHGQACYLSNLDDDAKFKGYPELSGCIRPFKEVRSEYAIPIFVSGRLIGTLNLESDRLDGYREYQPVVSTVAEQIGLTFAQVRREGEGGLGNLNAILLYYLHECAKRCDELMRIEESWDADTAREKIRDLLKWFYRSLPDARDPDGRSQPAASPSGLPDPLDYALMSDCPAAIIRELIGRKDPLGDRTQLVNDPSEVFRSYCLDRETAKAFFHAFQEAMKYALVQVREVPIRHHRKVEKVKVKCATRVLGGQTCARVTIFNLDSQNQPEHLIREVYRRPFRRNGSGRLRYGAYIVGTFLRTVGGDISMIPFVGRDGRKYVKTVLKTPLCERK